MLSTCSKCNGHLFQLMEQSPSGSVFRMNFVQCSSCGNPIGVVDYYDTSSQIDKVTKKLQAVESKLDQLEYEVSTVNRNLSVIDRKLK